MDHESARMRVAGSCDDDPFLACAALFVFFLLRAFSVGLLTLTGALLLAVVTGVTASGREDTEGDCDASVDWTGLD
jgi:hypothetical protein